MNPRLVVAFEMVSGERGAFDSMHARYLPPLSVSVTPVLRVSSALSSAQHGLIISAVYAVLVVGNMLLCLLITEVSGRSLSGWLRLL